MTSENEELPGGRIENKHFESYHFRLIESYRPPSRGGITSAHHVHIMIIDGDAYSFRAFGRQQWAHKTDTVSFDYVIRKGYKNIVDGTLKVISKAGKEVERGDHGIKPVLRTAPARMPASRREQRD